jgi:hypothetical protein
VPYHVYLVDPPTLLDDLLEASLRLCHNRCAIIQRVFHEHWLEVLGRRVGDEQIRTPDERPTAVEARARDALRLCRQVMRDKEREMIRDEEGRRVSRDQAIRTYVATRSATVTAA